MLPLLLCQVQTRWLPAEVQEVPFLQFIRAKMMSCDQSPTSTPPPPTQPHPLPHPSSSSISLHGSSSPHPHMSPWHHVGIRDLVKTRLQSWWGVTGGDGGAGGVMLGDGGGLVPLLAQVTNDGWCDESQWVHHVKSLKSELKGWWKQIKADS